MSARKVGPGIYVVTMLVMLLLLVAGVSVYYFFMLPPLSKPILYAEANIGGEEAGVNIALPRSRPLWLIVSAKLPGRDEVVGPTTIAVHVDGARWASGHVP